MTTDLPEQFEPLKSRERWVVYRLKPGKNGSPTKVPYIPGGGGKKASNTDPTTWRSFDQAQVMKDVDGLLYALTDDPKYVALDFDRCVENGKLANWAQEIVDAADTYVEYSPSGSGIHAWGTAPDIPGKDGFKLSRGNNGEKIEVYVRGPQFLSVTGKVYCNRPFADVSALLRMLQAERDHREQGKGTSRSKKGPRNLDELKSEIAGLVRNDAPKGSRAKPFFRTISAMHRAGWNRAEIIATLKAHPNGIAAHALDKSEAELNRQVDRVLAKLKPVIRIGGLSETAHAAEQAIIEAGLPLLRRDQMLMIPGTRVVKGALDIDTETGTLFRVGLARMRELMDQAADFVTIDGRTKKLKRIRPEKDIAETILSHPDLCPFPTVHGVISTPTLRPDGSLLDQPGYDGKTGLYAIALPAMPVLSSNPDKSEAVLALKELKSLLDEFPFDDEASKSVGLDALMTPVVRAAFDVTPMKTLSAPSMGTGKTYVTDLSAIIATGNRCPVQAWSSDDRENEKALIGAAVAGYPLLNLDNINGVLSSSFLCQLIERPILEVRVLGSSDKPHIEPRGMTIFSTGNNIIVAGDLVRRTVVATLIAEEEDPYTRVFKRDPLAMIAADRGRYIGAILTICRAYRAAGMPTRLPPLASFTGWSRTVREPLVWLGCADPVDTVAQTKADDPEIEHINMFYDAWEKEITLDRECTAADLIAGTQKPEKHRGYVVSPTKFPRMREALLLVAALRGEIDPRRVGDHLKSWKNRIVDGLQLVKTGTTDKRARWTVRKIEKRG